MVIAALKTTTLLTTAPLVAVAEFADQAVVVVYLLGSLVLGLYASRWLRGPQSPSAGEAEAGDQASDREDDYFLAGRRVPGWVNGVSFAATALNADVGPTYCGLAVVIGLPVAFFYLPRFALAWMIAAVLFAVRWRQLGVRTGPEFYAVRFSGSRTRIMRIYMALFMVLVNMVPWIGAGMLGVHKIFGPAFDIDPLAASWGVDPKLVTLGMVMPVLMLYVWTSGFAGVVVTDVMQSLVIVGASLMLLGAVFLEHGGPTGLADALRTSLPPEQAAEALSTWPIWDHAVLGPIVVLTWLIVPTVGRGGIVDLEGQRLFSCKSDRDAAHMNVWGLIGLCFMLLLLTLPALGLLVNHPELYTAPPAEREKAYELLLSEYLPTGLFGIALAALLASVMSTISSHLSYGSQTLLHDVLRPLLPGRRWLAPGTASAVWAGRLLMLVILGLGVIVTFNATSLIGIAIVLAGMYGATATVYWGQWWWWRVNFWSWLTAMVGGPITYALLGGVTLGGTPLVPGLLPRWAWWAEQVQKGPAAADGMAMLQAAIGMALTLVAWVAVTLCTQPEPLDVLMRFYKRARPMGLWGPVRKACLAQHDPAWTPPPTGLLVSGLGVAVIGAVAVGAGTLALSVATVGRWGEATLFAIAALMLGALLSRLLDKHLVSMDASR
ncbi:sodium:solute symporter family transporter [Botrimarina hoheduenensis]|uniref:Sodium/glucose cotransporter n=1 Tax=Botrimarina hoheduenensis TaxID=2528000 RepID=A0A5C5VTF2_9BACT|nr:sodium:solute symporter [Botrimarina hoheduenensis]TWT41407.1 Sodium/glucose cotransporter [Botrimarina hoheduenensis]